jgi:hypothetical protein
MLLSVEHCEVVGAEDSGRVRAHESAIPIQGLAGRVPQPVNPGVDSNMTEVRYGQGERSGRDRREILN